MTKDYLNRKFEFIDLNSDNLHIQNLHFNNCKFEYCNIRSTDFPKNRGVIEDITMRNCSSVSSNLGNLVVKNCTFENLKTNGMVQIVGAVYERVKLIGKFNKMMLINEYNTPNKNVKDQYTLANKAFYKQIDWAIDISKADFVELNLRGIPSDLVIRNEEFQAIIRKKNIPSDWKKLKFSSPVTKVVLDNIFYFNFDDYIFMACRRHPNFKGILNDIELLRKNGIADWN